MRKYDYLVPIVFLLFAFMLSSLLLKNKTFQNSKINNQNSTNKTRINNNNSNEFNKSKNLNVPFIFNEGQINNNVKYYAKTFAGSMFITDEGHMYYSMPIIKGEQIYRTISFKESLVGAENIQLSGKNVQPTKINVFKGSNRSKWKKHISTYRTVSLGKVYEGIDLELIASSNTVEKIFLVRPGANPDKITMRVEGGKLFINDNGELEIFIGEKSVKFTEPVAYQNSNGHKESIEIAYNINPDNEYGFKVGDYDLTKDLIIDPIFAATYIGGSGNEIDNRPIQIIQDSSGNIFISGVTTSSDFPNIDINSADNTFGGTNEVFISKLTPDLSQILVSTYIGGDGNEQDTQLKDLAIDDNDNIFIAGHTNNPSNFPGVGPSSADNTFTGVEGFILKLDSNLSTILAGTYLGGNNFDRLSQICLDNNELYVTGDTSSTDFPGVDANSADNNIAGTFDGFVAKLNSDLTSILSATYLGGSNLDFGVAIYVDYVGGSVYVSGQTSSGDFPEVGPGSPDNVLGGFADAFIAKLDSDLTTIDSATFLGGSGNETGLLSLMDIEIDSSGNVYVTGTTQSADFPGVSGSSADSTINAFEVFISKLDNDLSNIIISTFLGGTASETADH